MIDLHMHTLYSDGDKTVEEILKMCEEKKLEYISITDHDTCKQYEDEALKNNKIFSGKIIIGSELQTTFQKRKIEILAYDFDMGIVSKWLEKYYSEEKLMQNQKDIWNKVLCVCDKNGLKYDESQIRKPTSIFQFVEPLIYEELMKHEENYKILDEFTESRTIFFRKGLTNPNSKFCVDYSEFVPKYEEVIKIIHQAGGKAFFAHPFEYKFDNTFEFMDELINAAKLDGIECFHPSAEEDNKKDILVEYARKNNLYISGGSDYHGSRKPERSIGIGKGSLNIDKKIVEEWL